MTFIINCHPCECEDLGRISTLSSLHFNFLLSSLHFYFLLSSLHFYFFTVILANARISAESLKQPGFSSYRSKMTLFRRDSRAYGTRMTLLMFKYAESPLAQCTNTPTTQKNLENGANRKRLFPAVFILTCNVKNHEQRVNTKKVL